MIRLVLTLAGLLLSSGVSSFPIHSAGDVETAYASGEIDEASFRALAALCEEPLPLCGALPGLCHVPELTDEEGALLDSLCDSGDSDSAAIPAGLRGKIRPVVRCQAAGRGWRAD